MRLKLKKIKLESFKGIKSFEFVPNGNDALIKAENGSGKTTVYDSWLWLLFGKDSDGKTDFNVRPLDLDNSPIKGVVVAVEVELRVDGSVHVLRKEQHEKVVKGQLKGYETICKIDEVPKKVSEYQDYIINLCPEEMFKMLTDLAYFNSKMHWTARRKFLLDIAGNLPKPAGFEGLQKNQNGRTIKEYEDVLKTRLKAHKKERDEINPRIDELQRGLDEYAQHKTDSEPELVAKRDICREKVAGLVKQRDELVKSQMERQKKTEKINQLTVKRLHRENQLKHQTGPVDDLLAERAELERAHADKTQELVDIRILIQSVMQNINNIHDLIDRLGQERSEVYKVYQEKDFENCPTCKQRWPKHLDKPGKAEAERRGNELKQQIDKNKTNLKEAQGKLNKLIADEKAKVEELKTAEAEKNEKVSAINEKIKNRPEPDPTQDGEWKGYTTEIVKIQAELGEPLSKQLEAIEAERGLAEKILNEFNRCLNQIDNIKKTEARIMELEQQNRELAQKIADVEKELDEIQQYKMAESKMVEASVNGMFRHVTWKLFKYNLNGSIEDTCEALYQGVPYSDLSYGQKILTGLDIINTLGDYYGVSVPVFIDNSEGLTYSVEVDAQVIMLQAVKGIKQLEAVILEEKMEKTKVA